MSGLAVLLAVATWTGCWMEPSSAPRAPRDNSISGWWAGEYEGCGFLAWSQTGESGEQDVVVRIYDLNNNTVSVEAFLQPARHLTPPFHAEGPVHGTGNCYIVDAREDVKFVVDIVRDGSRFRGGLQVLDIADNVLWKVERLNLAKVADALAGPARAGRR